MRIGDEELSQREADWTEILSFVRQKGPQHRMLGSSTIASDVIDALRDLRDLRKLARAFLEGREIHSECQGACTCGLSDLKAHLETKK